MIDYKSSKLKVFWSYIKPYKKVFFLDVFLAGTITIVDLVFPIVSRWAMNSLIPQGLFKVFFAVMAIMFVSYFIRAFLHYLVTIVGHGMGTKIEADMRRDTFYHMQKLSFSFFDKNRTGVLLSRITNDLFEIAELAHHGPENILISSLSLIGSVIILFTINAKLTLVIVVLLPLCIWYSIRTRLSMQQANKEVKKETGEINAVIESGISGIRTSKAFANEKAEENKFDKANERFKKSKVNFYKAMGRFQSSIELTIGLIQVGVVTLGGYLIMKNKMDFVDLITFTLYISTFTSPIRKLTQFMELYSHGVAGFERFIEVMQTEPEIQDSFDAKNVENQNGDIVFKDVSFHYSNGAPVLNDINLTVRHGETVALVGPSGEGKTTICSLILRFYDVSEGKIEFGGTDIRNLKQSELRKTIGIIQQDVFLFADTIIENIRYGREDATDEEVIEAAKKAGIHDEIMNMPQGYDTYVGERGVSLSGGQKQRVSIARVILKNPPVLILDEATSALDSITEASIQKSLEELSIGKTCIIIAHRLSTIKNADRIVVIDNGQIQEQGSRQELLALNKEYAALEKAQATT